MTSFRKLSIASTVATFILVGIGGLVRATKSGLGCGTSWPDCSGDVIPVFGHSAVVIEYTHRVAAGIVLILIGLLAVTAFREQRESPRLVRASIFAFGLVMFQALLGAVVVKLELEAESVVLHLGTAMALLATLVYITINATAAEGSAPGNSDRAISRASKIAAGSVLFLLLVGSYISGRDAGYVFQDWPLMDGRVIPDLGVEAQALHFLHRGLAAVVGVIVVAVCLRVIRRKAEFPAAARYAHLAAGLFAVEVLIGAANVWTTGNSAFVTAHLAVGASIWASLVAMAVSTSEALLGVVVERGFTAGAAIAKVSAR